MLRRLWLPALTLALLASGPAGADEHSGLDRLKELAGEWVAVGEDGVPTDQVVSVFRVTAAGSAVHETLFPGTDHEMVTIYHLDGEQLVLTHYCALGNQPKLVADPDSPEGQLRFDFAGGTNFDPAEDAHMHEGSITFIDDDHIEWSWLGYDEGEPQTDHRVKLKLARKK